ncbi:class I SAM-dependent DNA methyltransferase [Segnochrobactrum spirostomi]|uniref:Methyltransferase domain-containing protein n=1 Tax=Segnochrobactrum spirostomi TaxID=2608987 RepID=A0A6A7Y9M4_9HYPH|nr:methyltransferase domain-containing protein [Segnochrobactrum spirostomi]MQT14352.1 methyltransferase domain-containing protein [Segnochrobactrum spirostomi]
MTTAFFHSSGDVLADRRYVYAEGLLADGDAVAAADLFAQAVELAPAWAAGWAALGRAREEAGEALAAVAAYRQALTLAPDDPFGASLKIAKLAGEAAPAAPPAAYVRDLFDQYAPRFESALIDGLGYRVPGRLGDLLARLRPALATRPAAHAVDLGCGTGLMAPILRPWAHRLDGVDLSAGMVAVAEEKGLYDRLAVGDVVAFLADGGAPIDLVTAADVFCYLGDLEPVFAAMRPRLAAGALVVFSVERGAGEGWQLQPSLRFAHGADYLRALAHRHGLAVVALEEDALRRDRGEPVAGLLAAFSAPG